MVVQPGIRLIEDESLEPTFGRAIASIALVSVLVVLLPFVLLALGTPVALVLRAFVELAERLVALF